jgi:uncharacterized protein
MFFFHWSYLLVLIVSTVIGLVARAAINNAYKKYSKVATANGVTGARIAKMILDSHNINDVSVNMIGGTLSDHYHPVKKQVNLSQGVYNSNSIAAVGVAAHECGHVIQHKKGYTPIKIRNAILPVANIGNKAVWPLVIIGFIAQFPFLVNLGIIFFIATVLFHLFTLPVELDATRRAVAVLDSSDLVSDRELVGVKKVLNAAAITYIAATLVSVINLLYLLFLRGRM